MLERTLVLIKPDAVQRGLHQEIMQRFFLEEFTFVDLRFFHTPPSAQHIEEHYRDVFARHPEYRENVIDYLQSGQMFAILYQREDAVSVAREMLGPIRDAPPGTIRGDLRQDQSDGLHTLVHASDSKEAAEREIALWFSSTATLEETAVMQKRFSELAPHERLFADAIAAQRFNDPEYAARKARECLDLLEGRETMEKTACGHVTEVDREIVVFPEYLHVDTARQRFELEGITV